MGSAVDLGGLLPLTAGGGGAWSQAHLREAAHGKCSSSQLASYLLSHFLRAELKRLSLFVSMNVQITSQDLYECLSSSKGSVK